MNSTKHRDVAILGGGISGLTVAWYLKKAGIPFRLFEKEPQTGGMISSVTEGDTVMDFGPNSLRDRNGMVRELAGELGLEDDMIGISEAFKTRYIVRDGQLQGLKPSAASLFSTKILSGKAKLRCLAEPFIGQGPEGDESIGRFLERRIGKEAVEYLVDPVFSGIYAGDIYAMSKQAVLPQMAEMEQEFGSLMWGALRAKRDKKQIKPMVLSFRKGIQQLTRAMADALSDHIVHAEIEGIEKAGDGYRVYAGDHSYEMDQVVSCLPAHALAGLLKGLAPATEEVLREIPYSPILSTQVIYDRDRVDTGKDGFGFLIPRKEKIRLLGAIWKTSIFPELTARDKVHFTLLTGGAHDPAILNEPIAQVEKEVVGEFKALMNIEEEPTLVKSRLWKRAIPQFKVGYEEQVQSALADFEERNPGFLIGGNYRWGVSVPDCMEGARNAVESLTK